jgi:basic amino acid/polyamine antiporter, APA family
VTKPATRTLKREVGVFGATMMGIGSMVGAGVFVSIGIAAGIAGPAVLLAIVLAAVVATCNALSSAQLAASLPVSGGTYEYGYAYLTPWLGFTAGWMFLCAKTASAATAALGFGGYLLQMLGLQSLVVPVAVAAIVALTVIVVMGIRRSNRANIVIVSVTLFALVFFILAGLPQLWSKGAQPWLPFFRPATAGGRPWSALLEATALMFVAFTGYARIATLGEEMREPERTIPRAIIATLVVSGLLYIAVGRSVSPRLAPKLSLRRRVRTWRLSSLQPGPSTCPTLSGSSALAPSRRCLASRSISFWACPVSCWRWVAEAICRESSLESMSPVRHALPSSLLASLLPS